MCRNSMRHLLSEGQKNSFLSFHPRVEKVRMLCERSLKRIPLKIFIPFTTYHLLSPAKIKMLKARVGLSSGAMLFSRPVTFIFFPRFS